MGAGTGYVAVSCWWAPATLQLACSLDTEHRTSSLLLRLQYLCPLPSCPALLDAPAASKRRVICCSHAGGISWAIQHLCSCRNLPCLLLHHVPCSTRHLLPAVLQPSQRLEETSSVSRAYHGAGAANAHGVAPSMRGTDTAVATRGATPALSASAEPPCRQAGWSHCVRRAPRRAAA